MSGYGVWENAALTDGQAWRRSATVAALYGSKNEKEANGDGQNMQYRVGQLVEVCCSPLLVLRSGKAR